MPDLHDLFDRDQLEGYRVGKKRLVYADSVERFKVAHGNWPPRAPVGPGRDLEHAPRP